MGSLWVVVDRCGIVVGRCGSLWIVVGRCGSFRVLVTTVTGWEAIINRKFAFLIDEERNKSEGITLDEYCSFIFRYKLGTQQIVFNYVYFYVK